MSLNYFDYFTYMSYYFEFKLNNSTFHDLHELSVWVEAIPVFFSKNLLKVIIGVEPEFGLFPKITEMLELVLASMYTKYLYAWYYPILTLSWDKPLDLPSWLMRIPYIY